MVRLSSSRGGEVLVRAFVEEALRLETTRGLALLTTVEASEVQVRDRKMRLKDNLSGKVPVPVTHSPSMLLVATALQPQRKQRRGKSTTQNLIASLDNLKPEIMRGKMCPHLLINKTTRILLTSTR